MLKEQPLDPAVHNRSAFDCGVPELNLYLQKFAEQHRRHGINRVYVLVDSDEPSRILGYYTLSAGEVDVQQLSEADRKKLPRFPIPCFRLGRLAATKVLRGQGIGKVLIGCAIDRCLQVKTQIGAYALLVDAKDAAAQTFYERYGFKRLSDREMTLYLPLGRD